jgi:hypothetical protein
MTSLGTQTWKNNIKIDVNEKEFECLPGIIAVE